MQQAVAAPADAVASTKGSGAQIAIFANSSCLYLNKRLCEHDSWNEAKIRERSGDLFENAKKIWNLPNAAS
ncbi:GmrSD restriction endonuclease domain-containing protein [Pontivivens nitratireducens]|uniref:DUF1524 domain-containing protein n=1 Tax=Pontivivens nitratireducens TaxID=2758038 RepID=A0A6G7VQW0_9RHOB|nr:DUF1524 domain-containing protein [Pontibrevibacter nitratireducens]QIK42265.1 DUF1524 domain-containing protein [Pontibrevibacter nitratireducens]